MFNKRVIDFFQYLDDPFFETHHHHHTIQLRKPKSQYYPAASKHTCDIVIVSLSISVLAL